MLSFLAKINPVMLHMLYDEVKKHSKSAKIGLNPYNFILCVLEVNDFYRLLRNAVSNLINVFCLRK